MESSVRENNRKMYSWTDIKEAAIIVKELKFLV